MGNSEAMTVAAAIRNFAWYFPALQELDRLVESVGGLTEDELARIEAGTRDVNRKRLRRARLLSMIAPTAAAAWQRNHPPTPGAAALLDAALALVARKALPWGSLLWQEYCRMTEPAAASKQLSWLYVDTSVSEIPATPLTMRRI